MLQTVVCYWSQQLTTLGHFLTTNTNQYSHLPRDYRTWTDYLQFSTSMPRIAKF